MLTIRREQILVLGEERARNFRRTLAAHLARYFPDLARSLGPSGVETFLQAVQAKAVSCGLHGARDITRFLNLCAAFGIDFDQQPANRAMRAVLTDSGVSNPSERLRILTAKCLHRLAIEKHNARAVASRPKPPALPDWL